MSSNIFYKSVSIYMVKTPCMIALQLVISLHRPPCILHHFISPALPPKLVLLLLTLFFHYLHISFSFFLQSLIFNLAIGLYFEGLLHKPPL